MQGKRLHWAIVLILVMLTLAWSAAPAFSLSTAGDEATWPTLTPTLTRTRAPASPTSTHTLSPTPTGSVTASPTTSPTASPTPTITTVPTPTSIPTVMPAEYTFAEVGQTGGRIWGADIVGGHAYVRIGPRLQVIDVSDPEQPILIGQSEILPAPGQHSGSGAYVRRVSVVAGYAYLPNGPRGLAIISVLDPTQPTLEGCYVSSGPVWDVAVAGDLAYVAAGEAGVRVLDITDKAHPREVGAYPTAGSARVVEVHGDLLCAAEEPGVLQMLDVSVPTQPRVLSMYSADFSVYQVIIAQKHAFLRARDGLHILDLSDPSCPRTVLRPGYQPVMGSRPTDFPNEIAVEGKYLYYIIEGFVLVIYEVEDPGNRIEVAELRPSGDLDAYQGIWVMGGYAYLQVLYSGESGRGVGLCVVDLSDPASPIEHGCYVTHQTQEVLLAWPFAYVREAGGIGILSIEDPAQPAQVGSYPVDVEPLVVADGYLYADNDSAQGNGLEIIDVRDPQHPCRAEFIPGSISDVAVSDGYAYVAHRDKLMIIDITDPYSAVLTSEWGEDLSFGRWITVKGGYVYRSGSQNSGDACLHVFDVADPTRPAYSKTVELESGVSRRMLLEGEHLYVMDGHLLRVFSVANPAQPTEAGSWLGPRLERVLDVVGRHAYLRDSPGRILLVDVSNPAQPRHILSWTTNGSARSLDVYEDFVYVGDGEGGLLVLRLVRIEGRCFLPIITSTD